MEPERVDVDSLLVLELERPLAAVLILGVLPLGAHVPLEKVVVGLQCQVRCRCNVVLSSTLACPSSLPSRSTYVDTPEFFNRVEGDDLLKKLGPVVTLFSSVRRRNVRHKQATHLAARGLGEPQSPCVHERVLDVEVLGVVEDGADTTLFCGVGRGLVLALRG